MADKSKISHFSPADSSSPEPVNSHYQDRSRLTQLYPKSKTYEQRKRDDKLRQQSYRRRWPRYPHLNIAAFGSITLGSLILFIQNLNSWWYASTDRGITMSNVFFSFAVGLGVTFLLIAWVRYVNKQLAFFGGLRPFWLIYSVTTATLLGLWLSSSIWPYTAILWIPVLAGAHFLFVFVSVLLVVRRSSTPHS